MAHKLSNAGANPPEVSKPSPTNGSSTGSRTGGFLGSLPGQISHIPRQKSPEDDEDEYEYEEEEEEEEEQR